MAAKTKIKKTIKPEKVSYSSVKTNEGPKALLAKIWNPKEKKYLFIHKTDDNRLYLLIGLVFFLFAFIYLANKYMIAAMVNGKPISRIDVLRKLENQGGSQVLDEMISKELIFQDAKAKGVSVSNDEIEVELSKIREMVKAQGADLDQLLAQENQTIDDVKENIRIQKLVEKLLGDSVKVSDEEVNKNYEVNKSSYPSTQSEEQIKQSIRNQMQQDKLSAGYGELIQKLRSSAKINLKLYQ